MNDLIVVKVDRARLLLAEARDATDAKKVADLARAAEVYAQRQHLSEEAIRYATAVKVDALTLMGEFLKASPRAVGGRPGKTPSAHKGVSGSPTLAQDGITYRDSFIARSLVDIKEKESELHTALRNGDVAIERALQDRARTERRAERTERVLEQVELNPSGTCYPVLYADPPWRYDFSRDDADVIENQYPTMELEAIKALEVGALSTDDSVLFLWATSPKLPEALDVLGAWGFAYRTCAVWDKEWIGPGYYFRQQHELLLVGTRGSLPVPEPSNRPSSVIREKRTKHSRKPEAAYQLIESMYPELPKVELFARRTRAGWGVWGNEVGELD